MVDEIAQLGGVQAFIGPGTAGVEAHHGVGVCIQKRQVRKKQQTNEKEDQRNHESVQPVVGE